MSTASPALPRPWSAADLLTVTEAAARLGVRRSDATAWLRARGLAIAVEIGGHSVERVRWGAVLDAWGAGAPPSAPAPSGGSFPWRDPAGSPGR